jgi:acetoin utilization protein AcuB
MQVADIMTRNPITGRADHTVGEVLEVMLDKDIRHLPIVAGQELIGMVSDRDLRVFSRDAMSDAAGARARLMTPVGKVMSGDVVTVETEDDIDEVIELMVESKIGAVPVVDPDGALVGIVSTIDVLRAAMGKL